MSVVPSDISPTVTTQLFQQGYVLIVRLTVGSPERGGEGKPPVTKTLTDIQSY
jgi:hypothetical protein